MMQSRPFLFGFCLLAIGAIAGGMFVGYQAKPSHANLSHRLEATIHLPTRGNPDHPFTERQWDDAVALLAKEFGGATLGAECEGCWIDGQGLMQREPVRLVIISFEAGRLGRFREVVRETGRRLGQEALYIRYEEPGIDILGVEK